MGNENSGKPKGDLIRLDNQVLINGKLEKSNFFNFLNMDLSNYSGFTMTPEEAQRFKASVVRLKYGTSAAIPLTCKGKDCINGICPFHETGNYPIAKQCLVEVRMIQQLTRDYMEQLNVDPESMSEMTLINKLVECDILDLRANLGLSGDKDQEAGSLLKTSYMESDNGVHSETTALHPLLEVKEKVSKIKLEVLKALVGTPQERYKRDAATGKSNDSDASKTLSEFHKKFKVSAKIDKTESKPGIIDGDWSNSDL